MKTIPMPKRSTPPTTAAPIGTSRPAKAAQKYLDYMAFSRSGLIEQLEYEGYTHDEAVYGVDKVY